MRIFAGRAIVAMAAFVTLIGAGGVSAAESFKLGMAVGLTGYAATVDTAWRDGAELAVDAVNAKGGVLGRKIELVVEDNRSQPQDAVTAYKKMISSDKVAAFVSGCVSAGNAAAAPMVTRAELPMVLCSILPPDPAQDKYAFSTLPPPVFEVLPRLAYIRDKTSIRKIGILHDPTPYANLQDKLAAENAPKYGLEIVGSEQYNQADADLSPSITKLGAAGAGALLKIGLGATTLTAAKNIKQLGLKMLLLTSVEDVAVFKPVAEVLGKDFFFVATPPEYYDALPENDPSKKVIGELLKPWRAKYGERDASWAGRGWDAIMLVAAAAKAADSLEGPKLRDALEQIHGFAGTSGGYNFSPANHYGITENPIVLAQLVDGKLVIVGK